MKSSVKIKCFIAMLILFIIMLPIFYADASEYSVTQAEEFDYRGPKCDELYIVVITSQEAQMLAFKKGEVDVLGWPGVPPTQAAEIMADPNLHVITTETNEYYPLVFNCRRYPFNITDFRRAIAHMIDRQKIVDVLLLGYGRVASSCIPKAQGIWFNPDVVGYEFNLTKAAQILDRLGFIDTDGDGIRNDPRTGENLPEFTIMIPSYDPIRIRMAQLIGGWAQEAGVIIKAAPTEHGTMIDKIVGQHDFDMCCWTYGWYPPWDDISLLYHSSQDVPWGWNDPGYHNASWDELIDQMLITPDMEELKSLIWTFQEWHMQMIPDFPLFEKLMIDAYRADKTEGWLSMPGEGIINAWSYMNVHAKGQRFGGIIRVPVLKEPKTLSPCKITSGWDTTAIDRIYDTLVRLDLEYNYIPWIAKSWNIESFENNTMVLTFYLNDNVTWHDGEPLTSEDVKFTIEYYRDYQVPTYEPYVSAVYKVETPDDYTVKVYLNTTSVTALYNIGVTLYILPKHLWENVTDPLEYEPEHPIGSGPFKFVEWVKGEYIKLVYNENFFRLPPERKHVSFELSGLKINPTKAYIGELVAITVTVKNPGFSTLTQTISLKVNGEVEDQKTVTLNPGQSLDLTFTVSKSVAGSYNVEIDGLKGSFTVEEKPAPAAFPTETVIGAVILIIVIVAFALYYLKRK